jgi:hypothetical protein
VDGQRAKHFWQQSCCSKPGEGTDVELQVGNKLVIVVREVERVQRDSGTKIEHFVFFKTIFSLSVTIFN